MYVSWFECFLATLIILPYKYGIIHLAEPNHIFEGFEDLDNYLQLDELNLKSIPVLIASLMEWHYLGIVNSAFSCFLLERTLATVLFNGPIILIPATVSSEKDWRKRFWYYVPLNKIRIQPERIEEPYRLTTIEEDTNIHFIELNKLWI
ncbi:hypothetical protein L5515_009469 [Caenorhabditis briggsae]|uniref:Uncharacterized protein n=1 Tax=Caenorhabditis briggsae TaxID=6238 RepID=A0AAE9JNY7_CAEBR|nr:hypothetical protein L5515_009469 [Caenorhabditis briggsae]